MAYRSKPLAGVVFVLLVLWVGAFISIRPARAATNRYVVNPGHSCGSNSPCYASIQLAINASQSGDTIIILENMNYGLGFGDAVNNTSGLTLKGTNATISVPFLQIALANNLTIQNLKVTDSLKIRNVTTKVRAENITTNGIYVQPTGALNAIVELVSNTLPLGKVCASNTAYCDISILGAEGQQIAGSITLQNNTAGAVNIFANVNNSTTATLAAAVTLDGNTIQDTADVGIRRNPGTTFTGAGNITGNIIFNNNTVNNALRGLNITIDVNTHGTISGNVTFSNNRADKIACITIDADSTFNNAMSGSITVGNNTGSVIEMGFRGTYSGANLNIQNNNLTYKGGTDGAVITVRANTFTSATTIRVGDNTGLFGIGMDTFAGSNDATVSIYNNPTYYVAYSVSTTNNGTLSITNNTVSAGPYPANPVNNPDWGYITMVSDTGALKTINILNNTAPKLYLSSATNIAGNILVQANNIAGVATFNSTQSVGSGVLTLQYNRIGTAKTDSVNIVRINSEVHFNAIMGAVFPNGGTVNSQRNWWGCNGGTGNAACQSVTVPNSTPYLTFNANLVCTGANNKIIAGYNTAKDSNGVYWSNISIPGNVMVSPSSGSVTDVNPNALLSTSSWNSSTINVSANATVTVSITLDRQSISLTKQCQTRSDKVGVYRAGQWFLSTAANGGGTVNVTFGQAGQLPVTGDWNGDGVDTIGVFDSTLGVFYLRDSNTAGAPDRSFVLGNPGDTPLAGRFDPTMDHDGAGVFRPTNGIIYLKRDLVTGFSDYFMIMGNPGDSGFAGDWNSNGYDGPGVFRPAQGRWYLSNNGTASGIVFDDGTADYGPVNNSNMRPVVGDWNADGVTGIGYLLNGVFTLRNNPFGSTAADQTVVYGQAGDYPVAGHWTAAAGDPNPLANVIVQPGTTSSNNTVEVGTGD